MLTQEQIKNLKPGDPIVVQGIFSEVYADGNIVMQIVQKYKDKIEHDFRFFDPYSVSLPSEHGTSLSRRSSVGAETEVPTTKHAPTRLFREGDRVRVVARDGRDWWQLDPNTTISRDEIYTVLENESEIIAGGYGELRIEGGGKEYEVPFYFLELVTPVEEMERYVVEPGDIAWFVVDKKHKSGELNVVMYMNTHPNPKAAAEAECARLNAEWRKEHPHD